jgi:hypothetical protein
MKISCRSTSISFCKRPLLTNWELKTGVAHLQLRAHTRDYPPEDLHTDFKYLSHWADGVATETETQVLVNSLDESSGLVGAK